MNKDDGKKKGKNKSRKIRSTFHQKNKRNSARKTDFDQHYAADYDSICIEIK